MNFKQIECFTRIVDTGSFSEAAEDLYISQSSLSKQIIALEKELGFPVFDRHKRRIKLTVAGNVFLLHARTLQQNYQTMLVEVDQYKIVPSLKITAFPVIAHYGIVSFIAQFKQMYPNIDLSFDEKEPADVINSLSSHACDLAFMRDNYLEKERYHMIEIAKDRLALVLSRNHPLAQKKQISLAKLFNENFIMFDKGTVVHELAIDACHSAGFEPRVFYASFRVETVLGLVASNSGVALMMEKVFDYIKNPDVVAIPLKEEVESRIMLVSLKESTLSPTARLFTDMIVQNLSA